jgi:alpha-glucosidase (family GH31 glycosyl hydrolase)
MDGNLLGAAQTLDIQNGPPILSQGLLSRSGFTLIDDSKPPVFLQDVLSQSQSEYDLYLFGHGHDYTSCIRDFLLLSGMPPLLPRYAFGSWWSRFLHTALRNISALSGNFRRTESLWQFSV